LLGEFAEWAEAAAAEFLGDVEGVAAVVLEPVWVSSHVVLQTARGSDAPLWRWSSGVARGVAGVLLRTGVGWPEFSDPVARKLAIRRPELMRAHGRRPGQLFLLGPDGLPAVRGERDNLLVRRRPACLRAELRHADRPGGRGGSDEQTP
jgi:hypothetical protein